MMYITYDSQKPIRFYYYYSLVYRKRKKAVASWCSGPDIGSNDDNNDNN